MSNRLLLRSLPLFILTCPLAVNARDAASIKPMILGQKYQGTLAPSPDHPNGEVCYGLSVEPNTRITLDIQTTGVGIVKFSVYDKTKGLRFFHNDVSSKHPPGTEAAPADSRFSFPVVSDVSQLCLTTTNTTQGQQYNFTATGKRIRKSRSKVALRPIAAQHLTAPTPKLEAQTPKPEAAPPAPPKPKPTTAPPVEIPPAPVGEPYCYVGTWQIADLNAYWLPSVQAFTQAKITEPQMLGYAKVTLEKNGNAWFEAVDLEQRYTLRTKDTGARIDRIGLGVSGSAMAKFQPNPDGSLTFSSQNYGRQTTKLNLGESLKFASDRAFMLFGDRDRPPAKLTYRCVDRDNMTLRIPLATGQKSVSISLKRIN